MLLFGLESVVSNWVLTAGGVIAEIDKAFCTDWSEHVYTKLLRCIPGLNCSISLIDTQAIA